MTTNEALKQLRAAIEEDIKNGNFHLSDYQPSETYDFHFADINNMDEELRISVFKHGYYGFSLDLTDRIEKDVTAAYESLREQYLAQASQQTKKRIMDNEKRIAELKAENEQLRRNC